LLNNGIVIINRIKIDLCLLFPQDELFFSEFTKREINPCPAKPGGLYDFISQKLLAWTLDKKV
jgi:hypothetical protein